MKYRNMKFVLSVLLMCVTIVSLGTVSAQAKAPAVYDLADLLTDSEEKELTELAQKRSEKYGVNFSFLTVADAGGLSTMVFSDNFYDENIADPDGVLFVIDMDNREVYINTVGSCIQNISDSEIDDILDRTYSYASDGRYATCFKKTLKYTISAMDDTLDIGEALLGVFVTSIPVCGVLSGIIYLVMYIKHNKNNKAPSAEEYFSSSFNVLDRDCIPMGVRHEIISGFYSQSSGSGGGAGRASGGSSHMSAGGVSHGGGGRKF